MESNFNLPYLFVYSHYFLGYCWERSFSPIDLIEGGRCFTEFIGILFPSLSQCT